MSGEYSLTSDQGADLFAFNVDGFKLRHNPNKWDTRRNRHTTTSGRDWGWIEGADGVYWEDGTRFERKHAEMVCRVHNTWLEAQKPILIRIHEAQAICQRATKAHAAAKERMEHATAELAAASHLLDKLMEEYRGQ